MNGNRLATVRVKIRSQEKVCCGEMKAKANWGGVTKGIAVQQN